MFSGMQLEKAQFEASLRHAAEACHALAQDLCLERKKVQELESRLRELYPTINSWFQRLTPEGQKTAGFNEKEKMEHLLSENQHQRELIACLQSTLHSREQTVQDLKATLDQVVQELPSGKTCEDGMDTVASERPSLCSSEGSCVEIITEKPSSLSGEV